MRGTVSVGGYRICIHIYTIHDDHYDTSTLTIYVLTYVCL